MIPRSYLESVVCLIIAKKKNDMILVEGEEAILLQVEPFVLARFRKGSGRYIILPKNMADMDENQSPLAERRPSSGSGIPDDY